MTLADFHQYWWLIFPVFGMGMGFYGMVASDRRTRHTLDLVIRQMAEERRGAFFAEGHERNGGLPHAAHRRRRRSPTRRARG